ncbi:MAG: hypothetical protein OSB19_02790 [Opitutaceae bacterium]|nr:hypothetical protein [Opitutaceae bacterium]
MFSKPKFLLSIIIALPCFLHAQDSINFPSIGEVLRFDKKMDSLVASDAKIEVLSSGFTWSDGSVLYITADTYLCRVQTKVKGRGF